MNPLPLLRKIFFFISCKIFKSAKVIVWDKSISLKVNESVLKKSTFSKWYVDSWGTLVILNPLLFFLHHIEYSPLWVFSSMVLFYYVLPYIFLFLNTLCSLFCLILHLLPSHPQLILIWHSSSCTNGLCLLPLSSPLPCTLSPICKWHSWIEGKERRQNISPA